MSVMLAFRCLAPAMALAGAGAVWFMAGPIPAALTLAIFLLGVLSNELHQMRWVAVEEVADADAEVLAAAAGAPVLVEEPASAPAPVRRRNYRCTCDGLAIGSGRSRTGLTDRTRHHALAAAVHACRKREAAIRATMRQQPAPPTLTFRQAYAERIAS